MPIIHQSAWKSKTIIWQTQTDWRLYRGSAEPQPINSSTAGAKWTVANFHRPRDVTYWAFWACSNAAADLVGFHSRDATWSSVHAPWVIASDGIYCRVPSSRTCSRRRKKLPDHVSASCGAHLSGGILIFYIGFCGRISEPYMQCNILGRSVRE